jgi:hypothetical protein
MKFPIILMVMMRSPQFKIGDPLVAVYPSRVASWSSTPQALSLIGNEPLSQMDGQGSTCRAPESCW